MLAGFPCVDFRVTLYDGSFHDVDSSDMAFKIAGSMGYKKGCELAKPTLLEPIMKMVVTVPEDNMGDIIGDLNGRRGRVLGVEAEGKLQVITAHVPMIEVLLYAPDLISKTGGRGTYSHGVRPLRGSAAPTGGKDHRRGQGGPGKGIKQG